VQDFIDSGQNTRSIKETSTNSLKRGKDWVKFGNTSILGGFFFCFTLSLCVMGFVCERKLDIERLYMQDESLMLKSFVHERKHLHPYFQIHVLTF
jgi:hypothetical protein